MYQEIKCTTTRYQNSFFPYSLKSWNNVGIDFSEAPSLSVFKKNITSLVRPKPRPLFGIHDNTGLKFLFQLRVGLSPLKVHKLRHNFIDTPNDICDCQTAPEDTSQYLFHCSLHALK